MLALGLSLVLAVAPAVGGRAAQLRRDALVHHRAGEALMTDEKYEEAAGQFRMAIALDPALVAAHYNLGYVSMSLKRYAEAVRAYEGCVDAIDRINNADAKEKEALERARLDELHDLQDMMTAVRTGKFKGMAPGPALVRYEERIRVLEQLRYNTGSQTATPAEVFLGLGSAYFRQNLLPEAERSYTRAVRANDRLGPAHNNLAVIYMMTGRFAQARASIAAAEKAGFVVDARLKQDLQARETPTGRR
jgi:tetratricopeptide (TPR) repeat protein